MRVIVCSDYEEMSRRATAVVVGALTVKADSVLGLATGSTPLGLYEYLIKAYRARAVDFSQAKSFNLDEYRDISPQDPNSYRSFMEENLFSSINMNPDNIHIPDGIQEQEAACCAYDEALEESGGIDVQILGIGYNGHIGFNEPSDSFPVMTHVVNLAENTRQANARFFPSLDDVPRQAITMGIGAIMKSKLIILLASGSGKAEILKQAICGPVTPQMPASILRFHPNVLVIVDKEAAELL